jgi:hypothetical protein
MKRLLHFVINIININLCEKGRRIGLKLGFLFGLPQVKCKRKESTMVQVTITNEQKVLVTLAPVTATNKPAQLDGQPKWTVVSGKSIVVPDEGGMSASLISSDDPGDTEIMVEADADLGEGVETISDIIKLTVLGAKAQSLGLIVGTPTPK